MRGKMNSNQFEISNRSENKFCSHDVLFHMDILDLRICGRVAMSKTLSCWFDDLKFLAEACNFINKRLWHMCFPVNFAKFLRTPFLTEHLRWLLLNRLSLEWKDE